MTFLVFRCQAGMVVCIHWSDLDFVFVFVLLESVLLLEVLYGSALSCNKSVQRHLESNFQLEAELTLLNVGNFTMTHEYPWSTVVCRCLWVYTEKNPEINEHFQLLVEIFPVCMNAGAKCPEMLHRYFWKCWKFRKYMWHWSWTRNARVILSSICTVFYPDYGIWEL